MKIWNLFIAVLIAFAFNPDFLLAKNAPTPAIAQCRITCTVSSVVEWSDTYFEDIDLELNNKTKTSEGQASLTLYTNGDVVLTADNSKSSELSSGSISLQTEYQLHFDGSGIDQTGAKPTDWCAFDTFLKEPVEIIHNPADGAVLVTLSVKASVDEINKNNTGEYYAIQTLTACWKS
ncbi:MAG: hypothetical protein BWY69_00270 [Planctomycetes bacterium ADurb.Bin401]|nr:MAG: hypothetical protein BWY69_00270 [Planctomycetes bacterium ADurb.Bin401]